MAFTGWFAFGGTEIINGQRAGAYSKHLGLHSFRDPVYQNSGLDELLNAGPYTDAATDNAPWYDPEEPASQEFTGAYPLRAEGLDSSTREATVTQFSGSGGSVGGVRRRTRAISFEVRLGASTPQGLEYGFDWFKQMLTEGSCDDDLASGCMGTELEFLRYEPQPDIRCAEPERNVPAINYSWEGPQLQSASFFETVGVRTIKNLAEAPQFSTGIDVPPGFSWGTNDAGSRRPSTFHTWVIPQEGNTTIALGGNLGALGAGTNSIPVEPGKQYTLSAWVRSSVASVARLDYQLFDGNSAFPELVYGDSGSVPGSTWHRIHMVSPPIPAGVTHISPGFWVARGDGQLARGDEQVRIGDVMITEGTELFDYFDGDFPDVPGQHIPTRDELVTDLTELRSTLYRVQTVDGPRVTAERKLSDKTYMMLVSFTMEAGDPSQYRDPVPLISNFPNTANFWVGGEPPGADSDVIGGSFFDSECPPGVFDPIYDPLCPPMQAPPGVPQFYGPCEGELPGAWGRTWVKIPASVVPKARSLLPILSLIPPHQNELRNIRIRWWDTDGDWVCDPLADWVVTWLPSESTLVFDLRARQIVMRRGESIRSAGTLAMRSDGGPIDWLELSCRKDYWLTLDVPGQLRPAMDLDLQGVSK